MPLDMATVKDILPIPENPGIVTDPEHRETAQTLRDEPTISHSLAMANHDEKGHAQVAHDGEVADLGWHEPDHKIPDPLVGGLPNDDLWILIRRFNKQMYHVKEVSRPAPGSLDLNIADEEEFSPDKLRASLERLYMTVIIGLMGLGKHIARIRSWRERRRTAAFCGVYFLAWLLDYLVPLFSVTMITLIVYPPSRDVMFPPAPLALVSSSTGGVQKPKAGVLGSKDSATGAPENYKGEAVEAEASNFVNGIANVALASASGKHPQGEPPEDKSGPNAGVPDPTAMVGGASDARALAAGSNVSPKQDKTKVPVEAAMWNKMRPIMHGLADVADTWERFANALEPTPPFRNDIYRLRLAGVVVPLLALSIFTTSYMYMKGVTFGVGFGFFSDPLIQPGLAWLNKTFPNWQKLLELRNTLLKGVPTNAQLTITLLRTGEANKAPLPPPPQTGEAPEDEPADVTDEHLRATGKDWPLNATDEELKTAMEHDPNTKHETHGADIDASKKKSHGHKAHHVLSAIRKSVKGSIETSLGADHLKAKAGSEHSKQRLGVIPRSREQHLSGPIEFKCRYHGKRGNAYISTRATIPCLSFSLNKSIDEHGTEDKGDLELKPIWSMAVADIKELKKIGGLGWKAKLVVGWALGREIADGIEIVDKQGTTQLLTAMVLRDELFNRLVAMGGQKWEAW
ncbi:profilin, required for normal timing of actin polymerization in response to thermal stress [Vermiconidia calcicola]|uniref:Profilin, required for normal timing of actin polymerization in response to thermal stress n=1 Tax=Vermiconidia calcicola TaxID=1690605 RepID=A0ACC3N4Z9_9PEZI|nr:profilin, required for normal timing of actin polymerization in response to thermal stress [Vermiconidia calcicola]